MSNSSDDEKRDEALKRALQMKPQPHKPLEKNKAAKNKAAKKRESKGPKRV